MDVNFSALASVAVEYGATSEVWRQDEFLAEWGLLGVIEDLRRRELESAASGTPMERLRWRNLVTGAETLLHPRGLGDFRVLVARV
jgi:SAM-dependent MidA family methyltransferase